MCQTYQGWTNRETWATALWINNDEGLYITVRNFMDYAVNDFTVDMDNYETHRVNSVSADIEELFDNAFQDVDELTAQGLNMLKDIGSLYRVNWREIAASLLSEVNA